MQLRIWIFARSRDSCAAKSVTGPDRRPASQQRHATKSHGHVKVVAAKEPPEYAFEAWALHRVTCSMFADQVSRLSQHTVTGCAGLSKELTD